MPLLQSMSRYKPHLPLAALLAGLAVVFGLRCAAVMQHLDMGQDIANYLTTMHTMFSHDPTGLGFTRPPLIAVPLLPFTLVFGGLTGVKVFGVLASVALGIPFYLVARRISHPWIAAATAILFVLTPTYSDMLTWGYITMTGMFFIFLALHFFASVIEKPSKLNIILTGVCISLIAGFHQLSFAFFVPLLLVIIAALVLFSRGSVRQHFRPVAASLALGGLLCLPYVPLYLRLLDMQQSADPGASISFEPATDLGVHLLYLPWLIGIVFATILVTVGLLWLRQQDRNRAVILGAMFLFSLVLSLFLLPPPFAELNRRSHFFLYFPVWLIAAVLLSRLWSWQSPRLAGSLHWLPKAITVGIIIASLVSTTITSQKALRDGLDYYGYLDDARWEAVQWVSLNTGRDAVTAAYPESLGWWIEAEAEITVCGVTARHMAPYGILTERSLAAERILSRHQGLENGSVRLANGYPYASVPGNPVLGAYIGGSYQDVIMFDDTRNVFEMEGRSALSLTEAFSDIRAYQTAEAVEMVTSYAFYNAEVTQTARLDQRDGYATVSYAVQSSSPTVTRFHIPIVPCYEPASVSIDRAEQSIEIVQEFKTIFEGLVPVAVSIAVETSGAAVAISEAEPDGIPLSFDLTGNAATVDFTFTFTVPDATITTQLVRYEVPQVIRDHSIGYVTVDLKPDAQLWSDLPQATGLWLDSCPYLDQVYTRDDVRVYRVDTSALP
jgi:hypothetical protein